MLIYKDKCVDNGNERRYDKNSWQEDMCHLSIINKCHTIGGGRGGKALANGERDKTGVAHSLSDICASPQRVSNDSQGV